jgi:heterodisulfide reductase subunit A
MKTGLFLCECGPNIADAIDLDRIAQSVNKDSMVTKIERHRLLCSEDGKKFLASSIQTNGFDRIVIAACSPKQHESTFMEVMAKIGMNPHLMQMVNIREQCAWVTPDKEAATNKALSMIRAAISRIKYHEMLEKKEIECDPAVIIIGGSFAGLEAALRTAHSGRRVYLLEEDELGGTAKQQRYLLPTMQPAQEFFQNKLDAVKKNKYIKIHEHCAIEEILGFFGSFVVHVRTSNNDHQILKAGAVILALDCQPYAPEEADRLGYNTLDNVCTATEFETKFSEKFTTKSGAAPASIGIIHCVGRNKLGYCSKMCCVNSMKIAQDIKKRLSNSTVTQFYKSLCLPDVNYEKYYHDTKKQGVEFVPYQDITVANDDSGLTVNVASPGTGEKKYHADIIVLSTGLTPSPHAKRFAEMFNIPLDEYGFLKEEHNILEPISTVTEGVYITSGMYGPGDVHDTIAQAGAAAGKILSSLVPGKRLVLETKISKVSETICMGCGMCVEICAYGAVKLDESKHISVVNEVLCRGCGNCASACPSGAALHRHFTNRQIYQEMNQILRK